jgi:ABC-2 type transport system permease protein
LNLLFELHYSLGTFLSLYIIIWLLAIISISLGIFVSNFARNEGQVFPFIPLILMPSVFFSGMLLPIDALPDWIEPLSVTTPMYYATEVIQGVIANGDTAFIFGLMLYGLVIMTLATLTLREQA